MVRKLFIFFAVLALATMACGFNIDLPQKAQPGPEVTDEINIDYPDAEETSLKLSFGAGDLILSPGTGQLVDGTAIYNYEELKPEVITDGGNVEIKMGNPGVNVIPSLDGLKNEWDFELGGLYLSNLTVKDGAANVELAFSEPNLTEMSVFSYATGASNIKMKGLANANFSIFDFSAGAGDYTLDFSGELQRDASIKIESGFSNVMVIIPEGVNAEVTVDSGVSNVSAGSGWSQNGNIYKQKGEGPTLTFVIELGAGNLTLTK
jgi:hypothetical protein